MPGSTDVWERYARELGVRLQRARAARGISQERAAYAAGISVFTYRKLEKGESNPGTPANPRLRTLIGLCEVLGVAPADLLPPDLPTG
ncbi:MAG: helix-turn-helix transcriptional regulator [Microbacterium sp.]|uniref:helix-turn-helix domain-containing protein n=1 Tax=Microbacterium sp. TaxID=51671 RepID=UPI0039E30BED